MGKQGKRNKFELITQNPIKSMHKHVHSKATYPLSVHQFTTQQVGNAGKRRNEFSLFTQNPIMNDVHSKATYPLSVHQFTAQQIGH